jgi:pimeloyl-ACP methyl ester carboxylesterase
MGASCPARLRQIKLSTVLCGALLPALGLIAPTAPARVHVAGEQLLELAGGRICYESRGTGAEALVFLHGFNSQLSVWNEVWRHLIGCGRSVRLDVPGYGGSEWPSGSYALPAQAERVISFMDALGLERATLVGVSMGGSLAAWIAARHPDRVKGLLLLAPSGYPGALQYVGPFGGFLGSGALNRAATCIAASGAYRALYPESRALHALTVTASYGAPWARALEDIRVHAWLLWSRGDACVPFAFAQAVAQAIPASTLVPLPAAVGHNLPGNVPALIGELACRIHGGAWPIPDNVLHGGDL